MFKPVLTKEIMNMKKVICILTLLSVSINITYAQTRGNPIDTLPQINLPEHQTPKVTIETQSSPVESQKHETIKLKEFKIQGVKTLPFEKIAAVFQPLTNKELTVEDLLGAGKKVTKMYQDAGYVLSFAYIPQQDLSKGIAQVVIVEGYVKDIHIKGKLSNNEKRIREILKPLTEEKPLTKATFDRVNGVLALQPGLKVAMTIAPPTTAGGATTVEAEITQKKFDFAVGIETGNPNVQGLLSATINSLTPLGDQLNLTTLQPPGTKDIQYYGVNYSLPLGSNGLTGKLYASTYTEHPRLDALNALGYNSEYKNRSQRAGMLLSYPLMITGQSSWLINGGFYINNEEQTYSPIRNDLYPDLKIKTRLSVFNIESTYNQVTEKQSRSLSLGLYKGVNILGANNKNNLNDTNFFKLKLTANQNFTIFKNTELRLAGVYQYSPNTLANSEQISFGGRLFGAAYQPGEIAGDKGWGLSSELNYAFHFNNKYIKVFQPFIAIDTSNVTNNNEPSPGHISSASIGFRLASQPTYQLSFSASKPIAHTPSDGKRMRYYVSYSYQF